jgi:methionyl-tRNA formyltransferase
MKICFLTTEDPLYLPAFFRRALAALARHEITVYAVPPLYKGQAPLGAALRYWRTFGLDATVHLTLRVLRAKLKGQSIESECANLNVPYAVAADVNDVAFLEHLAVTQPDVLVSVSCPQIFRKKLIELPKRGILNIHGAILPQYRGVMPSFWMLANGEGKAGVSVYWVNEAIDAGDRCGLRVFDISPEETLDAFLRRSKAIAADLLVEVIGQIEAGSDRREPLDLSAGSYYSWPDASAVLRFRLAGRRLW